MTTTVLPENNKNGTAAVQHHVQIKYVIFSLELQQALAGAAVTTGDVSIIAFLARVNDAVAATPAVGITIDTTVNQTIACGRGMGAGIRMAGWLAGADGWVQVVWGSAMPYMNHACTHRRPPSRQDSPSSSMPLLQISAVSLTFLPHSAAAWQSCAVVPVGSGTGHEPVRATSGRRPSQPEGPVQ